MLASTIFYLSLLSLVSAFPSTTTTATSDVSTNRYVPGPFRAVTQELKMDKYGALNVGPDGVLRSFAPDGTVLDFRQLDPDQVAEFAAKQVAGWEAMADHEVPASVITLANAASAIDGRLVTDLDQLLYPSDKPTFPPATHTSRIGTRNVFDTALLEKRACLIGTPCFSLFECNLVDCRACYYPNGPPLGVCFPE